MPSLTLQIQVSRRKVWKSLHRREGREGKGTYRYKGIRRWWARDCGASLAFSSSFFCLAVTCRSPWSVSLCDGSSVSFKNMCSWLPCYLKFFTYQTLLCEKLKLPNSYLPLNMRSLLGKAGIVPSLSESGAIDWEISVYNTETSMWLVKKTHSF